MPFMKKDGVPPTFSCAAWAMSAFTSSSVFAKRASKSVTPPTVAQGALQDVHWSMGLYGYFPTYSLGTIFSAQLFDKAREVFPDLDEQFARGEFTPLREWLTENIYQHARKFTLNELAVRVTGEPLQTRSYISYLKTKYSELYEL